MRNRFRYFLVPILWIGPFISFAGYMAFRENKIHNTLIGKALGGNSHAIAILGQYEKPWKLDSKVLNEALEGNIYALQIPKITTEKNPTSSL